MGIKKRYTIYADPPVPTNALNSIETYAERTYNAAVVKKKKVAFKIFISGVQYTLVALPTKGLLIVVTTSFAPRVWQIPGNRSTAISPMSYIRHDIDDKYDVYYTSELLHRIVTLPTLYYQTNRPESLLLESEYFFRVVGRSSAGSPLHFLNESCILLWGISQPHIPNPFFEHIGPKIFDLNLDVIQQAYIFEGMLKFLYTANIAIQGVARFPSPDGADPASLLLFNWYGTTSNLLQKPEARFIQTATGYIVTYEYLQAMIADMNKAYEDRQYTNFTTAFSFPTGAEDDPATVYNIFVPGYGFLPFTINESNAAKLIAPLAYVSLTAEAGYLYIYAIKWSDEVNADTGITTRTIEHSTMLAGVYLLCFNTDAFAYDIVNRVAGINSWGPDVSNLGYDDVVTQHTSYLNGDKIYARIGITYPTTNNTDTFEPPFPSPANLFDEHTGTTTNSDQTSGASVTVIDQYEMSINGPVPSNRFQLFSTYYTYYRNYSGSLINEITHTNTTIASNYDYPVAPPYNSVGTGSQIGYGSNSDPVDSNVPSSTSWSISGSILNPYYSYTYGGASGFDPSPVQIADEDSNFNYCYIKYYPSIFGDNVMIGHDAQYHLRPPNDAPSYKQRNTFGDSVVRAGLNSGDMTSFFNPVNIKRTVTDYDEYSQFAGHRGPWSYQDEEAFIYKENTIDNLTVVTADYFLGNRGWARTATPANTITNYQSSTHRKQYAYREGMAHHIENTTDFQSYNISSHTGTYRQNIYSIVAPDLSEAYISGSSSNPDTYFYGWFFQRWHFLDKDFNKLGELQLGYMDTDYNAFRDQLYAIARYESQLMNISDTYRNNDIPLTENDRVVLESYREARLAAEAKLDQFMVYNDFASIPLIYYCLRTKTAAIDHYIIMDDQDA